MKKKNPFKSLLFLLMIPLQLGLGALFIKFGVFLDTNVLFSNAASSQGHPLPVLTLLFGIIAGIVTLIVIIVSLILTIVSFAQILRDNKEREKASGSEKPPTEP